ncbi:MAG: DNA polymerase III subunit gamma/tau [Bacilli bacterium]
MNYLALYRKYRPSDFSSVVGQDEIKKILINAVEKGNITHAYLFSGPRGTGKTTTAKILAKMVNCEHLVDGHPCNECPSCLNIFTNNDVIEIDAASNNGVDEIRDLREKANLVPSLCKYKVYIIDEVHMLTTQAFNALLKILEEPPKHVIFILATTEYHKIPLTITSRCQKFQFNKLKPEEIVEKLKEISVNESISVDDDALFEIAKISDGGMRDSINFLDQLRSITDKKITINDVYDICGSISSEDICNLFEYISSNEMEKVTLFFEEMNANGKNYNKFFEDVITFLKDVILFKENVSRNCIKTKLEYVEKISKLYVDDDLFYIIDNINSLMDKLRYVSRQSVVVIANFLLIMNNINRKNAGVEEKKLLSVDKSSRKNDDSANYELAFNFTTTEKNDNCELTDQSLHSSDSDVSSLNLEHMKNRDIVINNAFAVASKKVKSDLQELFNNISDYLTDKRYASAVSLLVDTNIEVAGNGYIILTGKYDAIVDNINRNLRICEDFINMLFKDNYKIAVITNEEWKTLKNDYVNNIKSGKKYQLREFENSLVDDEILNSEPTVVDKLFDLVGEDIIEFK